jgi:thioredoxin-like negative regulator of GroEL
MIDFYTSWCTWCKRLDQDTYVDGRVVKLASQLHSVKLNAEDGGEGTTYAQKYGVRGFPAIIFVDAKGEMFAQVQGYQPPERFTQTLQGVLKMYAEFGKLRAKIKKNPKDGAAAAGLAKIYASQSKTKVVEMLVKIAEANAPNHPDLVVAYNELGTTYGMGGEYAKAQMLFEKVLKRTKNPTYIALANFHLGLCHLSKKENQKARGYFQATLAVPGIPAPMREKVQQILNNVK